MYDRKPFCDDDHNAHVIDDYYVDDHFETYGNDEYDDESDDHDEAFMGYHVDVHADFKCSHDAKDLHDLCESQEADSQRIVQVDHNVSYAADIAHDDEAQCMHSEAVPTSSVAHEVCADDDAILNVGVCHRDLLMYMIMIGKLSCLLMESI